MGAEPRPEFLEMVGRLAGTYCPPMLSTEVIEIVRSAAAGRTAKDMDEVETVAAATLDAALVEPGAQPLVEDLRR
jgi:hypothetical protein